VTIAVGHARIVTLTPVTTDPAEGTYSTGPAARAARRAELLAAHRAARTKRDAASLGSADFQAAAEEIASIEVQINRLEEPEPGV
jgi:hypothetical protein